MGQIPPRFCSAVHNHAGEFDDLMVLDVLTPRRKSIVLEHILTIVILSISCLILYNYGLVFANIAPLVGVERNVLFQETEDGKSLKEIRTVDVKPGEILEIPPDGIHCIENLSSTPSRAFHCYGGNFKELDDQRDLWSWESKEKVEFSLPNVVKESVVRMRVEKNVEGLQATANAIPKVKPLVDAQIAMMEKSS